MKQKLSFSLFACLLAACALFVTGCFVAPNHGRHKHSHGHGHSGKHAPSQGHKPGPKHR